MKLNYHRRSEHPESFKHHIPFAQTLRLRRICTPDKEFQLNLNELRKKLTERGYKELDINESIQRIQTFDRNDLLKEKEKKQQIEYHLYALTTALYPT